jgi:protein-disulfide isomerase
MWLALAAFCLAAPLWGTAPARAEMPALAPDDHVLGKTDAPITIIEYASLGCPHCAEFERDTLPKIKADWIETGKAKLIYRDFPLDGAALRAAMLARCAPADRYFAFIDALFQSQNNWERAPDPLEPLSHIAKLGGLSDQQFKSCMSNESLRNSVAASRQIAEQSYGVQATPTFFVNGEKIEGAPRYDEFTKALTAAQPKS